MNVLHYLGIRNEFKGKFKGSQIEEVIEELRKNSDKNFAKIIESLARYDKKYTYKDDKII